MVVLFVEHEKYFVAEKWLQSIFFFSNLLKCGMINDGMFYTDRMEGEFSFHEKRCKNR